MRTPAAWTKNIRNGIITDEMLEAALFSVNKRAKNYRDKKREYSRYRIRRRAPGFSHGDIRRMFSCSQLMPRDASTSSYNTI